MNTAEEISRTNAEFSSEIGAQKLYFNTSFKSLKQGHFLFLFVCIFGRNKWDSRLALTGGTGAIFCAYFLLSSPTYLFCRVLLLH